MKQQQQPPIADPSREPLEEGEIDGGECVRGSLPVLLDCPRTEGKVKEKRVSALFTSQIFPQIPLCKKKILRHIKIPAHAWSTKCR
jgi:hypothetical protein